MPAVRGNCSFHIQKFLYFRLRGSFGIFDVEDFFFLEEIDFFGLGWEGL